MGLFNFVNGSVCMHKQMSWSRNYRGTTEIYIGTLYPECTGLFGTILVH